MQLIFRTALALAIGAAGGAVFHILHFPLPWTLGSLAAAALTAVAGRGWLVPIAIRDFARPVVGIVAGSAFTPAVLAALPQWWPAIATVGAYTLLMTVFGWVYFTKLCGHDSATGFFSSSPGGLSELTLLGSTLGGDIRTLVLVHSARVVVVVFSVPFLVSFFFDLPSAGAGLAVAAPSQAAMSDWFILALCGVAGYAIGKALRVPGGVMVPALLLSAATHASGTVEALPPSWLIAAVQVVIGSAAGARFAGVRWREVGATLLQAVIWAVILIAMAFVTALISSLYLTPPTFALILALSPGGMAEMTVIAFAIGAEAAFVITCQVCRILLIYLTAPILFRFVPGQRGSGGPPSNRCEKGQ